MLSGFSATGSAARRAISRTSSFAKFAEGKFAARKLFLRKPPEKIGLILCGIECAKKLEAASGFVAANPGVVAGGETIGADLASHAEQRLKLHVGVAVGASDRSASAEIVLHERAHDAIFKLMLEVYDVVGKVKMLRDALGVVDIVERAAAMLRRALSGERTLQFGQAALIPELHGKPDDGASLLLQNGGDGRRIHSARHGDSDEPGLSFSADRQRRFELRSIRHLSFN